MEEKIIKQVKTSCPFPLLIYKTSVKYNEVRKASGIAFILLELILKSSNSKEKISNVLLKFGIPSDLHYIFGNELAGLIGTEIISSVYPAEHFSNVRYFSEILINEISLTPKGLKMFKEGAIPTGAEKTKVKDIFFSPVTRRFDVQSTLSYSPLANCYLGDEFLDNVDIDISGLEDYINAHTTLLGLKAEERVVSFEIDEPQKMNTRKEEGLTIIIRPSGVEFAFDTSDETAFFYKYYSSSLMTRGLLMKNSYKFVNADKKIVQVPTVSLKSLNNAVNIHLPVDLPKQATRPCKIFLNRGTLGFERTDNVILIDKASSACLLDLVDKNAEFALLDLTGCRYYNPLNVVMPCAKFNDTFEMQLLIENLATGELFSNVVKNLYDYYQNRPFDNESGKVVMYVVDALSLPEYFSLYANKKLTEQPSVDDKIDVLLKFHSVFSKNAGWTQCFINLAENLFAESIADVRLDNMIYKNTVLTPLKEAMKMNDNDYIYRFSKKVAETEECDLVYQALETAGFKAIQILGIANVVEKYMQGILLNDQIITNTELAVKFKTVSVNLWKINNMLGIESDSDYTIREDYNVDEFFNAYSTLLNAYKDIEKYKRYATKEYDELNRFIKIYEPIHELLAIERTSSSHPDKITKKYIDEYVARGKYKEAICDLLIKLQFDLRYILNADKKMQANELIDAACNEKLIGRDEVDALHKLRMCRNGFQHPGKNQILFDKTTIEKWRDIVFSVKGENE